MNLAVFDLDGTLTRTDEVDSACFVEAFREAGFAAIDTDWSSYLHCTDSWIAREIFVTALGREPDEEELRPIRLRFAALLEQACRSDAGRFAAMPGAGRLLIHLLDHGWAVAIATGAWSISASVKLLASGLGLGLPLVGSDRHHAREDIVLAAIEAASLRSGQGFDRIVSLGNAAWDVRTAAKLGLPFVGIGEGAGAERLRAAGAACILPDFADLDRTLSALRDAGVPKNPDPLPDADQADQEQ